MKCISFLKRNSLVVAASIFSMVCFVDSLNAQIEEEQIIYTDVIMKGQEGGLNLSFADAIAALRSGLLDRLRKDGNIKFVSDNGRPNYKDEGRDAVMKLLVNLFPSSGGSLNINTSDFSKAFDELSKLSEKMQAEVVAGLLAVCHPKGNEIDKFDRACKDEQEKIRNSLRGRGLRTLRRALLEMFETVKNSVVYETSVKMYTEDITELMILAFCCKKFTGITEVKLLLDALLDNGLIAEWNNKAYIPQDLYSGGYQRILGNYKNTINAKVAGGQQISLEEALVYRFGTNRIVPFSVFDETRLVQTTAGEFSDCVENTLRQLITMMCPYNPDTGSITVPDGFNNAVKTFLTGKDVRTFSANDQTVHNEWAEICLRIPRDVCQRSSDGANDLDSSMANIVNALVYLTGYKRGKNFDPNSPNSLKSVLESGRQDVKWNINIEKEDEKKKEKDWVMTLSKDGEQPFRFNLHINPGQHAELNFSIEAIRENLNIAAANDIAKFYSSPYSPKSLDRPMIWSFGRDALDVARSAMLEGCGEQWVINYLDGVSPMLIEATSFDDRGEPEGPMKWPYTERSYNECVRDCLSRYSLLSESGFNWNWILSYLGASIKHVKWIEGQNPMLHLDVYAEALLRLNVYAQDLKTDTGRRIVSCLALNGIKVDNDLVNRAIYYCCECFEFLFDVKRKLALQEVIRLLHEDKFSNMHFTLSTKNYAKLLMFPELIDSLNLGNGNGNQFSLEEPNNTSVEEAIEEYIELIEFINKYPECDDHEKYADICLNGLKRFLSYVRERFDDRGIELSNNTINKIEKIKLYDEIRDVVRPREQ